MNKAAYTELLTPVERAAAIKLGACMSLGQNGMTMADWQKRAGWADTASYFPKSILVTALLAGIPLGALAHIVGRSVNTDNRKEREALDRLRYYQRMTAGMESGLAGAVAENE